MSECRDDALSTDVELFSNQAKKSPAAKAPAKPTTIKDPTAAKKTAVKKSTTDKPKKTTASSTTAATKTKAPLKPKKTNRIELSEDESGSDFGGSKKRDVMQLDSDDNESDAPGPSKKATAPPPAKKAGTKTASETYQKVRSYSLSKRIMRIILNWKCSSYRISSISSNVQIPTLDPSKLKPSLCGFLIRQQKA